MADLCARWPKARYVEEPAALRPWVEAAFGTSAAADTPGSAAPLHLIGAPFQIKVWEALLSIPSGHVATYSDIAARLGNPQAVRAVGTAVGRNPVAWLIPSHRAIRKSRRAWRLSLVIAGQAGNARLGIGTRRGGLSPRHPAKPMRGMLP